MAVIKWAAIYGPRSRVKRQSDSPDGKEGQKTKCNITVDWMCVSNIRMNRGPNSYVSFDAKYDLHDVTHSITRALLCNWLHLACFTLLAPSISPIEFGHPADRFPISLECRKLARAFLLGSFI